MDTDKTQRKLGIYFAAINVVSLIIAAVAGFFTGIKGGLIAFIASLIVLTIIIQEYAQKRLITDGRED